MPVKKSKKLPIEVLIVEDNDVNQIVYDQIMSNCGYHYLIVSSGEEGVNTAAARNAAACLDGYFHARPQRT